MTVAEPNQTTPPGAELCAGRALRERRAAIALFVLLAGIMLLCYRGFLTSDADYFVAETDHLLAHGTLGREVNPESTPYRFRQGDDGRFYGVTNEMGMILSILPFHGVAKLAGSLAPPSLGKAVHHFVAALHGIVFTLLAALLLLRMARLIGVAHTAACIGILLFVAATPMLNLTGKLYREPLVLWAQCWALLAFFRAYAPPPTATPEGKGRALAPWMLAAALAVLAIVRLPSAVATFSAALVLVGFHRVTKRTRGERNEVRGGWVLGAAAVGIAAGWCALRLWSALFSPGLSGAGAVEESVGSAFRDVNGSEAFVTWAGSVADAPVAWWVPLKRFVGMFIAPGNGTLWYAPAVVIGLAAMCARSRRRTAGAFVGVWLLFLYAAGYALFAAWFSGAWGVRYLAPAMALPCLFAGEAVRRVLRDPWPAARRLGAAALTMMLFIGVCGAVVNDRPLIREAPSGRAFSTRYDQAWRLDHTALYFHAHRVLNPDFGPLSATALRAGEAADRSELKKVFSGYVVWWVLAWRAGVWPNAALAAGVTLMLAVIGGGLWLVGALRALPE